MSELKSGEVRGVDRDKRKAERHYDKLAPFYDYLEGTFEEEYRNLSLDMLGLSSNEAVLEIGVGTGHALCRISEGVGENGKAVGLDISKKMLNVSRDRFLDRGLWERTYLVQGDGADLPFKENIFDAVFMSFTLELFDTPEITEVLRAVEKVLKEDGRLGIVSLAKEDSFIVSLYEMLHDLFPTQIDCRPIYLEKSLKNTGFSIDRSKKDRIYGVPIEMAVATI